MIINTGTNTSTNSGTLKSTSSAGLFINSSVNNSNTIEALGTNAKVVIQSTITDTVAGLILASGSGAQVDLANATILGGTLQTSGNNAAIVAISGNANVLDNVTISAGSTVDINSGATLTLDGTVSNLGVLVANGGTLNINGVTTGGTSEIGGTGKVVIETASSENVTYLAGSTGQLVLDQAPTYTGQITGFGANNSQSIDLADINFSKAHFSYAPNALNTAGVLTVTDGTNTAHLQLEGTYTLANFHISNDGQGGTQVIDPPVVMQSPGDAPASIASGTVLEINTPDHGAVTFAGSTGSLWLDQPSTFTGTVAGFKGQDVIDLPGVSFGKETTLSYLSNDKSAGGILSVSDGAHSATTFYAG